MISFSPPHRKHTAVAHMNCLHENDMPISFLQGTPRRKKKVVRRTATTDDKKLQNVLKKLSVNNIPGIEEVRGNNYYD